MRKGVIDNDSDDNPLNIIQEYMDKKIVTAVKITTNTHIFVDRVKLMTNVFICLETGFPRDLLDGSYHFVPNRYVPNRKTLDLFFCHKYQRYASQENYETHLSRPFVSHQFRVLQR